MCRKIFFKKRVYCMNVLYYKLIYEMLLYLMWFIIDKGNYLIYLNILVFLVNRFCINFGVRYLGFFFRVCVVLY